VEDSRLGLLLVLALALYDDDEGAATGGGGVFVLVGVALLARAWVAAGEADGPVVAGRWKAWMDGGHDYRVYVRVCERVCVAGGSDGGLQDVFRPSVRARRGGRGGQSVRHEQQFPARVKVREGATIQSA